MEDGQFFNSNKFPDFPLGVSRSTPAAKRKRTLIDESEERSLCDFSVTGSAKGDIEITDFDAEGKYVKLLNKGKQVSSNHLQLSNFPS